MAMRVMHCLSMKLRTMFGRTVAACRHRAVVTLAVIEVMIDVTIEMLRPVVPGACTNKHAA